MPTVEIGEVQIGNQTILFTNNYSSLQDIHENLVNDLKSKNIILTQQEKNLLLSDLPNLCTSKNIVPSDYGRYWIKIV